MAVSHRSLLFSVLLATLTVAGAAEPAAPFGIDRRPQPSGTDLAMLLPAKVGEFQREALPRDAALKSDEDFETSYRRGGDSVSVGISRPETAADAREAVEVSREEAVRSKLPMKGSRHAPKGDPAYFAAHDFIAWTRGSYFFYAKASSPEALARFMSAFPW